VKQKQEKQFKIEHENEKEMKSKHHTAN